MKKTFSIYALASWALVMMLGIGENRAFAASPDAASPVVEISIDNFSFTPAEITVKAGTQITWTNRDDIPHTVMSSESAFKSKALDTDDKFSFTPTKPGTYSYFCSLHPKMTAKIVVQ